MSKAIAILALVLLHAPGLIFMGAIDLSWATACACSMIVGLVGGLLASGSASSCVTLFGGNFGDGGAVAGSPADESSTAGSPMPAEEFIEV